MESIQQPFLQMESIQQDHDDNSIEESSLEQLITQTSPEISNICGNQKIDPRIGYEYQVEIPSMISESEHRKLLANPFDSEGIIDISHSFLIGLPIPIMWVVYDKLNKREGEEYRSVRNPEDEVNSIGSGKSRKSKKNCIMKNKGSNLNVTLLDDELGNGKESKLANPGKADLDQLYENKNCAPVPGSLNDPWTDAEVNGFVLGLYIFGKNFVQIKRFIENKEMGEILSFYYGKFYKSLGYRRWSDCRKTRRKKCIYGQKLFTGWRQHELFSRLHPHVPEHLQNCFQEVSTAFTKGKFSLEDYVSTLKTTVGIDVLIEAIGIGKGKEDLTGLAMEPARSNPLFPVCPIGKACSSLTSSGIIKLLTGEIRLSKARRNDVFWEAVWPRLLAKGWHSEQLKNQGYIDPKHNLVFLIPNVKKFSRRKLVKGNHYFDSVSDVLSKVASEPKLLELEEEAGDKSCMEEDFWIQRVPSDMDDPSVRKSHCYLKPRISTCNPNLVKFTVVDSSLVQGKKLSELREMTYSRDDLNVTSIFTSLSNKTERIFLKDPLCEALDDDRNINNSDSGEGTSDDCGSKRTKFTIVDTSLVHGGNSSRLRELRYSPLDFKVSSEMINSSVENDGGALVGNVPDASNVLLNGKRNVHKSNHRRSIFDGSAISNQKSVNSDATNKLGESLDDQSNVPKDHKLIRTIKHQFSRRVKSHHSNNLVPLVKRRRLTACSKIEISHVIENFSVGLETKELGPCSALSSPEAGSNAFKGGHSQEKLPSTSSSAEGGSDDCCGAETSKRENVERQPPVIDLKLPQVALESENVKHVKMVVENSQDINANHACFQSKSDNLGPQTLKTSKDISPAGKQPNRRQSTRNRPLTIRALAALEYGFLDVKKRQKTTGVHTKQTPLSSPSRRARSKLRVSSNCGKVGTGTVDAKDETDADKTFDVESDFVGETFEKN